MRRLDTLSRAELWEVSRFTVDLLWGIRFATHKRAARGLNDEGGKILWRRLDEVAFNLYHGSQLPEVEELDR